MLPGIISFWYPTAMLVVTVIPISRGIHIEELTYFTAKKSIEPGTIVTVPLRGRGVPALVIGSSPVNLSKAELKSADFAVKKIERAGGHRLFSTAFIEACRNTARYHAASLGSVLFKAVPSAIFAHAEAAAITHPRHPKPHALAADKTVLVSETATRTDLYRNIIRESFAKKHSIMILVPTRLEAQALWLAVQKGIEEYVYVFTGAVSGNELVRRWKAALESSHPVCVIATPPFISLPRHDLSTIVIERESSGAYVLRDRPHLDYRILAEKLVEALGIRILYGDLAVRAETYFRYGRGELAELARVPKRVALSGRAEVIDMRKYKAATARDPFVVISPEFQSAIAEELSRDGKVFVYAARRGLAPTTVCLDCGTTKTCERCDAPFVLHKTASGNVFICHTCGMVRPSEEKCRNCTSWRLQSFGLGTERVAHELAKLFPDASISILDSDHAPTNKAAIAIGNAFAKGKRHILVGTERGIAYLPPAIPLSGIAAFDTLLSVPQWRAYETTFSLIMRLREITEGRVLLQTRKPDALVMQDAVAGQLLSFYERELGDRKRFAYPPYSTLIRVDAVGTRARFESLITEAEARLSKWHFMRTPKTSYLKDNQYRASGILRLPRGEWPNPELWEVLRSLPPAVTIRVDPESVV